MSKIDTLPFDAARYLTDPREQTALLSDAFASGEPAYITTALGTIARARGMSELAREIGMSREGLYKALSPTGDPRLSTLLGILKALNLQLSTMLDASHETNDNPAPAPPRVRKRKTA